MPSRGPTGPADIGNVAANWARCRSRGSSGKIQGLVGQDPTTCSTGWLRRQCEASGEHFVTSCNLLQSRGTVGAARASAAHFAGDGRVAPSSLLTLDGERHVRMRRLRSPPFTARRSAATGVPGRRAVPSRAVSIPAATFLCADPVRRRPPSLHRRELRAHGDEDDPAHSARTRRAARAHPATRAGGTLAAYHHHSGPRRTNRRHVKTLHATRPPRNRSPGVRPSRLIGSSEGDGALRGVVAGGGVRGRLSRRRRARLGMSVILERQIAHTFGHGWVGRGQSASCSMPRLGHGWLFSCARLRTTNLFRYPMGARVRQVWPLSNVGAECSANRPRR
jgi:hypothetical protein